jgi:hypothetical protein
MKRKASDIKSKCAKAKLPDCGDVSRCTLQQAVRFVLERQGLVERFHMPSLEEGEGDLSRQESVSSRRQNRLRSAPIAPMTLQSFEALMPLHATGQTTPPLSLLARVHNFHQHHLTTFLQQSRQSPLHYPMLRCMRGTLHLVPADKHHIVAGLYNFEGCKAVDDRLEKFNMDDEEFQHISSKILKILSTKGPMLTQALTVHMKNDETKSTKFKVRTLTVQAGKTSVSQSNVSIALHAMVGLSKIQYGLANSTADSSSPARRVRAKSRSCSSSTDTNAVSSSLLSPDLWRETRRLHGIADIATCGSALVKKDGRSTDQDQLLVDLMKWYFDLYSPASFQDFVWWSGRKVRESRAAMDTLLSLNMLKEVHVQGLSCICYVCSALEGTLLGTEDALPTGIRFLPYEDAIIKAYKETRHRFYYIKPMKPNVINSEPVDSNEKLQELAFWKGEAHPTIWMDGQIIGRWKWRNVKKPAKSVDSSSPVVTVTTQSSLTKKSLLRIANELNVLCGMLECCPKDDVEFSVQCDSDSSNCIIRV